MRLKDEQAFCENTGLTKREYLAMLIFQQRQSDIECFQSEEKVRRVSSFAVRCAEILLQEIET